MDGGIRGEGPSTGPTWGAWDMSDQHGGGWACGTCATPNSSGSRFCVHCGTAHAAGPAGPPPTPAGFAPPPQPQGWPGPPPPTDPAYLSAPPPAPPSGPGTGRIVLIVAALAVVAIVAGVGLGLALTRDGDSADEVATEDGSTDDGTSTSVAPPPTIGDAPTSTVAGPSPTTGPAPAPAPAPTTTPATAPPVVTAPPPTGGPFALGSWVAVRVSLRSQGEAEAFRNANVPGGTVIRTDDYPSLTPGYWVVAIGPFASADEALGRCSALGISNREDCFGAPLTADPGDRDVRAYPD